jgi:hypothetical protein
VGNLPFSSSCREKEGRTPKADPWTFARAAPSPESSAHQFSSSIRGKEKWLTSGQGIARAGQERPVRETIPSFGSSVEEGAVANIIVASDKMDDHFHAEINEHTADGYSPILMNKGQ